MTDQQIQDIYSRLDTLNQKVSSLELLTGTIGTSQVAIAQLLSVQSQHSQILNSIVQTQAEQSQQLSEILRILRDRNGGSGL
ncbi:MAG: hypothetical protein HWQ35_00345 [Nostoc sp. NMS1]|uniref:hypothetical protein n=1 Tax=unclassified Nostoc TaxID=2593658 RepID=UPI0025F053F7|nr:MULTISPECIES: hypothetical protein [unclassified Nostoc]MBN3905074.1 hypothetical protein [Nostoc sp. NMS1]MBN3993996.1 hypothetical protein [Nostoc sp. NMS2]